MKTAIRRIAKSALIGAVWADLHLLLLLLFYKIFSFKDVDSSISRPLIFQLIDLVLNYTLVLPWKSAYHFITNTSGIMLPSLWDILVTCSIIGGLLGMVLLSWAKKPVKRALKLSALTIGISALFIGIILIERIPGIKPKERQPLPPRTYAGPNFSLPEGFWVEEVEISDVAAAVPSTAEKGNAEERISFLDQEVDDVIYRLTTYRIERWPWPYVLMRKKRSDSKWSVLGPFLPGLGVEGFPAFNLSDNPVFIEGDCLKWIVKESVESRYYPRADERRAKNGGKIWKCSLPLPAYSKDSDGDSLSDVEEAALLTDPQNPDCDGDGVTDGWDPSPFGWYKGNRGRFGLIRGVLPRWGYRGKDAQPISFRQFIILFRPEGSDPRPHADSGSILLTLQENEERVFRNRIGVGNVFEITNFRCDSQEVFLFGLVGLASTSARTWGLSGRGYELLCFRSPFGGWKVVLSRVTWIS